MKNKLKKTNWKDIGSRALKTFVQAFVAVLLLGVTDVTDIESGKTLAIAALAAGISAVWNFVKETL